MLFLLNACIYSIYGKDVSKRFQRSANLVAQIRMVSANLIAQFFSFTFPPLHTGNQRNMTKSEGDAIHGSPDAVHTNRENRLFEPGKSTPRENQVHSPKNPATTIDFQLSSGVGMPAV